MQYRCATCQLQLNYIQQTKKTVVHFEAVKKYIKRRQVGSGAGDFRDGETGVGAVQTRQLVALRGVPQPPEGPGERVRDLSALCLPPAAGLLPTAGAQFN